MNLQSYVKGDPLRIGTGRQLLLDDYLVEDRFNVWRRVRQPLKHPKNPVVGADKPWERWGVWYPEVIYDQERKRFRMWYTSGNVAAWYVMLHPSQERWDPAIHGYPGLLCYAESEDGINWEKPLLDLVGFSGHDHTNVIFTGNAFSGQHNIIFDEREAREERRFKMLYNDLVPRRGVYLAFSPDGTHWTAYSDNPVVEGHYDNPKPVLWDEDDERWIMITRPPIWALKDYRMIGAVERKGRWIRRSPRRRIAVSVSEDLINWSFPRTVFVPDEADLALEMTDFDNMTVWRHGGIYLGFLAQYRQNCSGPIKLAFSRDGIAWEQLPDRPDYIPLGREGDFDAGFTAGGVTKPVEFAGKWWQYYGAYSRSDEMAEYETGIGLVRMHPEGLVEQYAGPEGGFLLTREFVLEGDRLEVNCVLHNPGGDCAGDVQVEIITRPGPGSPAVWSVPGQETSGYDVIPGHSLEDCDPIAGNYQHAVVSWRSDADLGPWRGRAVYLRFFLREAGLYAFQVVDTIAR